MLMPHATDLLVGRSPGLPDPAEMEPRSQRASRPRDPGGMVQRLAKATVRVLSLFL